MNNPLTNVLTPRVRAVLYAALFVGALAFAAWQAADGDWLQFVGGLITALLGATAASNASWTPVPNTDLIEEPDEGGDVSLPNTDSIHGGTGYSPDETVVSGNAVSEATGYNDYGYRGEHRA